MCVSEPDGEAVRDVRGATSRRFCCAVLYVSPLNRVVGACAHCDVLKDVHLDDWLFSQHVVRHFFFRRQGVQLISRRRALRGSYGQISFSERGAGAELSPFARKAVKQSPARPLHAPMWSSSKHFSICFACFVHLPWNTRGIHVQSFCRKLRRRERIQESPLTWSFFQE